MSKRMRIPAFCVRVAGRNILVTDAGESFTASDDQWTPVDVRDLRSGMESQAIINVRDAASRESILAEPQVRDAIKSAILNGTTTWTSGPDGWTSNGTGVRLPDGFTAELA